MEFPELRDTLLAVDTMFLASLTMTEKSIFFTVLLVGVLLT